MYLFYDSQRLLKGLISWALKNLAEKAFICFWKYFNCQIFDWGRYLIYFLCFHKGGRDSFFLLPPPPPGIFRPSYGPTGLNTYVVEATYLYCFDVAFEIWVLSFTFNRKIYTKIVHTLFMISFHYKVIFFKFLCWILNRLQNGTDQCILGQLFSK